MKKLCVVSCPIATRSGYGSRSRDFVRSLIQVKGEEWDIRILPQRWGNTPWKFCKDNPEWGFLLEHVYPHPQLTEQPDIWMQITVPNEFTPVGKYNIGCTAGMETTLVDGSWIEGVNRMDVTLVSSEHSKTTFLNSIFEKRHTNGQSLGQIKVEKPIEVLFEGANLDVYFPDTKPCLIDFNIKEDFAYLFV